MPRIPSVLPLATMRAQVDDEPAPVSCRATDYPAGWRIDSHSHAKHQLIYAVRGVMTVQAEAGDWVVPPSRGIWMPAGMPHAIRCIGALEMRSVFVRPGAAPRLMGDCRAVAVSPLLRELIRAAVDVPSDYARQSRDGRLMRLILDELQALPLLPLHLPLPADPRVLQVCRALQQRPDDDATLADWAGRLGIDARTIQRLFQAQTGMSFGRWRQQARLLRALEMLAGGDKVIDVSMALGYDSPSAFATMFKRQFGKTPSDFFADLAS